MEIIESFLEDMKNLNDDIEVMGRAWEWLREKYHADGPKKLKNYQKDL